MSATRQKAERIDGNMGRREQETELRDRAHLSQERRLKQATQFIHKDSADLLPLDSLKRLGTSKDLQPHSVIQRRLMEGNLDQFLGESSLIWGQVHGAESSGKTSRKEAPALLVHCKCRDQVLRVAVDTGTQHNQISARCLSRLGLGEGALKAPAGKKAPGPLTHVEQLELQLGQETVACSAQVVDLGDELSSDTLGVPANFSYAPSIPTDDESPEFCLGLETLISLKCCIDLEHGVLRLRSPCPGLPFLPFHQEPGQ